jgi:hypothetical protein
MSKAEQFAPVGVDFTCQGAVMILRHKDDTACTGSANKTGDVVVANLTFEPSEATGHTRHPAIQLGNRLNI